MVSVFKPSMHGSTLWQGPSECLLHSITLLVRPTEHQERAKIRQQTATTMMSHTPTILDRQF